MTFHVRDARAKFCDNKHVVARGNAATITSPLCASHQRHFADFLNELVSHRNFLLERLVSG